MCLLPSQEVIHFYSNLQPNKESSKSFDNYNICLSFYTVHALVYEPTTGEAKLLPVDFGSYLRELRSVYDLYRAEDDMNT